MRQHAAITMLTDANRPIRLRLYTEKGVVSECLLIQRVTGVESVCGGIEYRLLCVGRQAGLKLKQFIAMPVELTFITSSGATRLVRGIVDSAEEGEADGALATYQLVVRDALALMDQGCNSRIFRAMNELEITERILSGWRQENPVLAYAFSFELWRAKSSYPKREFTMQYKESDAAFLRRLWKRRGLAWFFQPTVQEDDKNSGDKEALAHTLVLFDDPGLLIRSSAGTVRFHRDDGTEQADSITAWQPGRRLRPGVVARQSWDYKSARSHHASAETDSDQGHFGTQFAQRLTDRLIEVQHVGENGEDFDALASARAAHHAMNAKDFHGEGGGRDWAPGQWFELAGHGATDQLRPAQRQFAFTELRVAAENNLPKTLSTRINRLFARSGWSGADTPQASAPVVQASEERDGRYTVHFNCVRRHTPIVPLYDPRVDLPRTEDETVIVVGPAGESVHCDGLGRVQVRFPGCRLEDANGSNDARGPVGAEDSAWVLVSTGWAGAGFGIISLPRVGTTAIVSFLGGDPDKPIIVNAVHSGLTPPPRFSHVSSLPAERYLAGMVSREIGGARANQLRMDDTPGQISAQLASDHAATQINLGFLTHPRSAGQATPRGAGFELATDNNGSIRTAQALLMSTWGRLNACAEQLSAEEHIGLLRDCADLFKALGEVALANQAMPIDPDPQAELQGAIEAGLSKGGGANAAPTLNLSGAAGIAFSTPKTLVSYAGTNIDTVAQNHLQLSSGQRFTLNAGKGISMFSQQDGITQIAQHGKYLMQSQHDDMEIDVAKDLKVTVGQSMTVMAQDEITFVVEGGAYLKLKGGAVEIGGPDALTVKTDGHHWDGPACGTVDLPRFFTCKLGRVPCLVKATDGQPVEGAQVKVECEGEGEEIVVLSGTTSCEGKGPELESDKFQRFRASFYLPQS